jgi:molybdate transport system substrate-binding protein
MPVDGRLMHLRCALITCACLVSIAAGCTTNNWVRSTPPAASVATTARIADSTAPEPVIGEVTVFAASSLTDAFNQIGAGFQKANPGAKVIFDFAASSTLRTQLQQGAKADVFASADQPTMDGARSDGSLDGPDQLFAKNKLVVIFPKSNPGKISTIQDLSKPGLKIVLTDKGVPIGAYARRALDKLSADPTFGPGFSQKVLSNLKSDEANVRAVVSKVQLGEADAAITYATDITPSVAKDVQSILIPDQFNIIATYPIAVVTGAANNAGAHAFIAYVRSPAGQAVLKQDNFILDNDTGTSAALPRPRTPEQSVFRQESADGGVTI